MSEPADMGRRQALRLLAVLGLWPLSCIDHYSPTSDARRLLELRPDREAAALLGRAWLDAQSGAPSTAELLRELAPHGYEGEALREALEQAHRKDLFAERYERIAGWRLSRTEVRLYALLALVA